MTTTRTTTPSEAPVDAAELLAESLRDGSQPMPPIEGVSFPRDHAEWCDVRMHRLGWADSVAYGYGEGPPCQRGIAGGYLPEVRRCEGLPPTRTGQPPWEVGLERAERVGPGGGGYVDDAVVVLSSVGDEAPLVRLLPGEARELAAALIRAADVEAFGLPR